MSFTVSTQYNFLPRFYRLASVSVLSNMMVPLAGLVDIAFLGHLTDIRHLAGVILATILFDYLYRVLNVLLNFVLFGWFLGREMMGAGLATAISQYLALLIGLVGVGLTIDWKVLPAALKDMFNWVALKDTFVLKSNILIRFVALISVYSIFTNLSSLQGTNVLAKNGLLLQIAFLSQFAVQGVGLTTQTLTGNFKSKGNREQMIPLLIVSMGASLTIALTVAFISIIFPDQVFGLLTNHSEINTNINRYTIWLLPILVITAIAFILEGYFIGLKEGTILRNAVLIAFFLGFIPLAIIAWYFQNNHLLWATIVSYMTTIMVVLGVFVPQTLNNKNLQNQELLKN